MRWNRWYTTKSYLSSALWIVPLIALVLENVIIRLVFWLQKWLSWLPWFATTSAGTTEALNTIETMTVSFIVFTFGSILIAIQVASGQLTPRIIATTLLRDNVIRFTVGLFIFTMLFAVGTGARIGPDILSSGGSHLLGAGHRLDRGVSVPDRLHRAAAATHQYRLAHRKPRDRGHRKRVSQFYRYPSPAPRTRDIRDRGPCRRAPRHLSDCTCRESEGTCLSCPKAGRYNRVGPPRWQLRGYR